MNQFLLFAIVFCFPVSLYSQSQKLIRTYNGDNRINVSTSIANDIISNNKYISGYSQTTAGNFIAVTIKYNSFSISPIWTSKFGFNSNSYPSSIAVLNSDGVYVTGTTDSNSNEKNMFLLKYDLSNGNLIWSRFYIGAGNGDDGGKKVILNNGFVYVAGYSKESDSTGKEYLLVKYNASGTLIWKKNYSIVVNSNDEINDMSVDNSTQSVYVTGKSLNSGGNFDYATIRYDFNGNQKWVKRYSSVSNAQDEAVSLTSSFNTGKGVAVTGYADSTVDYLTIKYDTSGNVLWEKMYNGIGNGNDYSVSVKSDNFENVLVTGSSWGGTASNYNFATIKYLPNGDSGWVNIYNSSSNDSDLAVGMEIDNFNCIFVTGKSKAAGKYDITSVLYSTLGFYHWIRAFNYAPFNNNDIPFAIVKDLGTNSFTITGKADSSSEHSVFLTYSYYGVLDGTSEYSSLSSNEFELHQNYPNPFNPVTEIKFEIGKTTDVNLSVFDITGKEVLQIFSGNLTRGSYTFNFDATRLSSGIYLYKLSNGYSVQVRRMIFLK